MLAGDGVSQRRRRREARRQSLSQFISSAWADSSIPCGGIVGGGGVSERKARDKALESMVGISVSHWQSPSYVSLSPLVAAAAGATGGGESQRTAWEKDLESMVRL